MSEKYVYFIFGKDAFYVSHEVERLLKHLIPNGDDRGTSLEKYSSEMPLEEVLIKADSLTLGFNKRVILIEQPSFLGGKVSKENEKKLLDYVHNPNPKTILIFSWVVSKKLTKFQEKFAKTTQSIALPELRGKYFEKMVQDFVRAYEKNLDKDVLFYLVQRQQVADNKLIIDELEKACLFIGERTTVSVEDLVQVSSPTVNQTVFDLLDSVMDGNLHKAFKAWKDLLYLGEEPMKILSLLIGNFKRILMIQSLLSQGHGKKSIEENLKEHPFVIEKGIRSARKISPSSLTKGLAYLLEQDISLKTISGIDSKNTLEDTFVYLCALVKQS